MFSNISLYDTDIIYTNITVAFLITVNFGLHNILFIRDNQRMECVSETGLWVREARIMKI